MRLLRYWYSVGNWYELVSTIPPESSNTFLPPVPGSAARPLHRCSPKATPALRARRVAGPPWSPSSSARSTDCKARRAAAAWEARAPPSASPSPPRLQLALVARPGGDLAAICCDSKIKAGSASKTLVAPGVFPTSSAEEMDPGNASPCSACLRTICNNSRQIKYGLFPKLHLQKVGKDTSAVVFSCDTHMK